MYRCRCCTSMLPLSPMAFHRCLYRRHVSSQLSSFTFIVAAATLAVVSCGGKLSGPQQFPPVISVNAGPERNESLLIGFMMNQLSPPYDIGALSMAVTDLQNNGYLANFNVSVTVALINCEQQNGTFAGIDLINKYKVNVVIGPPCAVVCRTVGLMASYWNTIFMPTRCRDPLFDNATIYNTMMRSAGSAGSLGRVVQLVMQNYGWRKAVLLSDKDENQPICAFSAKAISDWFSTRAVAAANYSVNYVIMSNQPRNEDISTYLDTISRTSRVVVFCHSNPSVMARLVMSAQDRGMMNGDYAFIAHTDFPTTANLQPWTTFSNGSLTAAEYARRMEAYYSVKLIAVDDLNGADQASFFQRVQSASAGPPWNLDSTQTPSILSLYLYDAVSLYFQAADGIKRISEDLRNSALIFKYAQNRVSMGQTGRIVTNNASDRINKFAVWAYRPGYAAYYKYLDIDITQPKGQEITTFAQVVWGYTKVVPADIPACGLQNQFCPPQASQVGLAVGVSLGVIGAVVIGCSVFFVRYQMKESKIAKMTWKIEFPEIVFSNSSYSGFSSRSTTVQSTSNTISSSEENGVIGKPTAVYRGINVHVHMVEDKHAIKLTRHVLVELAQLKEMNHDNILTFVGACVDLGNVCIVTMYCSRGSVQNLLDDDEHQFDWVFKVSMVSDIVNGMKYLHKSPFQSHGNLSSNNCYVDNRWVVKVGGFGLHSSFRQEANVPKVGEEIQCGKMLWTSPELLRTAYTRPPNGTQKGDVYSFAIIVQQILYRAQPYFSENIEPKEIIERVMSRPTDQPCYRPTPPNSGTDDELNPLMLTIMKQCWAEDPIDRPNFADLVPVLKRINNGRTIDIVGSMLQKLEKYAENLELTVKQRTTQLEEEKRKTDLLLYSMLPPFVAEELKAGRSVAPQVYESATLFFSDIVGYTQLSSESTPLEVIDLLNDLYSLFDDILLRNDVYKVETIGDAYMVVSGLPRLNGGRHICEISNMALTLLDEVYRFKVRHRPNERIKLRIGIHTGLCAAGVVGHAMPRYCLFGDTVNVASRMESSGEALKIHMSQWAHEALLKFPGYITEPRGETFIEGKGMLPTFWLLGRNGNVQKYPAQTTTTTTTTTTACVTITTSTTTD